MSVEIIQPDTALNIQKDINLNQKDIQLNQKDINLNQKDINLNQKDIKHNQTQHSILYKTYFLT